MTFPVSLAISALGSTLPERAWVITTLAVTGFQHLRQGSCKLGLCFSQGSTKGCVRVIVLLASVIHYLLVESITVPYGTDNMLS